MRGAGEDTQRVFGHDFLSVPSKIRLES